MTHMKSYESCGNLPGYSSQISFVDLFLKSLHHDHDDDDEPGAPFLTQHINEILQLQWKIFSQ